MHRVRSILWCALFFGPLAAMIALDGFCTGRELCHAGLALTLFLYAGGILAFAVAVIVARLVFAALKIGARGRIRTMKLLFILPLVPAVIILGLLCAGFAGRLG